MLVSPHNAIALWKNTLPCIKPILGLVLAKAKLIFIHFVHNRTFCVKMMIRDELISTIHLENKTKPKQVCHLK